MGVPGMWKNGTAGAMPTSTECRSERIRHPGVLERPASSMMPARRAPARADLVMVTHRPTARHAPAGPPA